MYLPAWLYRATESPSRLACSSFLRETAFVSVAETSHVVNRRISLLTSCGLLHMVDIGEAGQPANLACAVAVDRFRHRAIDA